MESKLPGNEHSWPTSGGRWLRRLDAFLAEPLRGAAPEEISRYRMTLLVALCMMAIQGMSLLSLPWSPQPAFQGLFALFSLGLNGWAVGLLCRRGSPRRAALLVCLPLFALLVANCCNLAVPWLAAHAVTMVLPALSVYLVGARLGLYLTLPICVLVGLVHPVYFMWFEALTGRNLAILWILDVTAALCMLCVWGVSWLFTATWVQAQRERDQALRLAHESELKVTTLIDTTDDLVCSMDLEGRLIVINSALRAYHREHHGLEVFPGERLAERIPSLAERLALVFQNVREGRSVRLEETWGRQGTRVMEMSVKPMRDAGGQVVGLTLFGRDITDRKEAEYKLTEMHRSLVDVSRQAGMAEVVTGLLHNVGNTLNSINVSVHLVTERIRTSRVGGMVRATDLLHAHREALGRFLEEDPRGKQLPTYMHALSHQLVEEQQSLLTEQRTLTDALDHVKSIISMQQEHARVAAPMELVQVGQLIDDALRLHAVSFQRSGIEIHRQYDVIPPILLDRHKLLQILLNLLSNARHALLDGERRDKRITIRLAVLPDERLRIQVADNGQGISPEHLTRMFTQGFTTKKEGHGFGLHISALAAIEMAGALSCESEGLGRGATFTIDLPMQGGPPA